MGRCGLTLTDHWSIQNNQAGIANLEAISVGIFYETRFLLQELSQKDIAFVAPTPYGVYGLSVSHFGYDLFSQVKVGLAYARAFGQKVTFGFQLDYLTTQLPEPYSSSHYLTFELGIQTQISDQFLLAAHVFNPIGWALGTALPEWPVVLKLGAAWQPNANLRFLAEAEKNSFMAPILFRAGFEYAFAKRFLGRCGFTTHQEIFSLGFGMTFKRLILDLSAIMHQTLGFSPQASLIVNISG